VHFCLMYSKYRS